MNGDDFLRVEASDCPMSSCAAPAGSPCRTGKGKVAAQYHIARFRLVPHLAKALSVPVPPLRKPDPARVADYAGLPPAYIDVGDLDIFRDEAIAYAQNLARAGVPIELHVHPGVPHGWERFAPNSSSARRAMADRARAVASI